MSCQNPGSSLLNWIAEPQTAGPFNFAIFKEYHETWHSSSVHRTTPWLKPWFLKFGQHLFQTCSLMLTGNNYSHESKNKSTCSFKSYKKKCMNCPTVSGFHKDLQLVACREIYPWWTTKPWTTKPPGSLSNSNFRMKLMSKTIPNRISFTETTWIELRVSIFDVYATWESGFGWEKYAQVLEYLGCLDSQKASQFNSSLRRRLGFWNDFHLSNDVKVTLSALVFLGGEGVHMQKAIRPFLSMVDWL